MLVYIVCDILIYKDGCAARETGQLTCLVLTN